MEKTEGVDAGAVEKLIHGHPDANEGVIHRPLKCKFCPEEFPYNRSRLLAWHCQGKHHQAWAELQQELRELEWYLDRLEYHSGTLTHGWDVEEPYDRSKVRLTSDEAWDIAAEVD